MLVKAGNLHDLLSSGTRWY